MLGQTLNTLHCIKKRFIPRLDLAQVPLISNLRKKIISLSRTKIVQNVNGYTMHVDENDSFALSWHRIFEPATTGFFKKNIQRGQTVIDLGANIGYYTLLFSGLVGPEGHVYAFEPEPESAKLLRKNLEINSIKNVTVVEKAVDSVAATHRLYINRCNPGNHQIFDTGEDRESIEIQTTTIDTYFANQNIKIDWIKMDIEGAEYRALQGMKNTIQKNKELILVTEIYPDGLTGAGTTVADYVRALEAFHFEFEEIDERRNRISSVSAEELIGNNAKPRRFHPNMICRRSGVLN